MRKCLILCVCYVALFNIVLGAINWVNCNLQNNPSKLASSSTQLLSSCFDSVCCCVWLCHRGSEGKCSKWVLKILNKFIGLCWKQHQTMGLTLPLLSSLTLVSRKEWRIPKWRCGSDSRRSSPRPHLWVITSVSLPHCALFFIFMSCFKGVLIWWDEPKWRCHWSDVSLLSSPGPAQQWRCDLEMAKVEMSPSAPGHLSWEEPWRVQRLRRGPTCPCGLGQMVGSDPWTFAN